jgi:hypothetical protein
MEVPEATELDCNLHDMMRKIPDISVRNGNVGYGIL